MSTTPSVTDTETPCGHDGGDRVGEDHLGGEAGDARGRWSGAGWAPATCSRRRPRWRRPCAGSPCRGPARAGRRGRGRRRRGRPPAGRPAGRASPSARPPDRTAWPSKNDTKLSASPTTRVPSPTTRILAVSSTPRRGMAAREDRIVPEPYSPLMASTPSTPMASDPMARPASDWLVGSNPWYHPAGWWSAPRVASQVTRNVPTAVTSRVQRVERNEASLVHSARMAWGSPARQGPERGGAAGDAAGGGDGDGGHGGPFSGSPACRRRRPGRSWWRGTRPTRS